MEPVGQRSAGPGILHGVFLGSSALSRALRRSRLGPAGRLLSSLNRSPSLTSRRTRNRETEKTPTPRSWPESSRWLAPVSGDSPCWLRSSGPGRQDRAEKPGPEKPVPAATGSASGFKHARQPAGRACDRRRPAGKVPSPLHGSNAQAIAMKKLSLLKSLPLLVGLAFGVASVTAYAAPPPPPPGSGGGGPPPPPGGGPPPPPGGGPPLPPGSDGPPVPPGQSGQPSAEQNQAEEAYKAEAYEAAALVFHKIAYEGAPGDATRAQFWLGKALFQLGFFAGSLAVFDEIVTIGPSHPYHQLTLPWLASLSRKLPEGAGVLEKVGTYRPQDLENEALDSVRDELYFLLGRYHYNNGDLGQAIALLSQVPRESDFFIPAQYFLGVAETREYHGPEAVEAFKNVLRKNAELRQTQGKKKNREARERARMSEKEKPGLRLWTVELHF